MINHTPLRWAGVCGMLRFLFCPFGKKKWSCDGSAWQPKALLQHLWGHGSPAERVCGMSALWQGGDAREQSLGCVCESFSAIYVSHCWSCCIHAHLLYVTILSISHMSETATGVSSIASHTSTKSSNCKCDFHITLPYWCLCCTRMITIPLLTSFKEKYCMFVPNYLLD